MKDEVCPMLLLKPENIFVFVAVVDGWCCPTKFIAVKLKVKFNFLVLVRVQFNFI